MQSKLFHRDVFFPKGVSELVRKFQDNFLDYTISYHFKKHLDNQKIEDKSHTYLKSVVKKCLNKLSTDSLDAFEVELTQDYDTYKNNKWHLTKYCCRIPYNNTQSLVVVIRPKFDTKLRRYDLSKNKVITAWLNSHNDNHSTLNASKYCSQEDWLSCE